MKYSSRYPGVKPFETEEQHIFFGRSSDVKILFDLVGVEKTVLLYSKSGLGKSSLINAGLIPRLKEEKKIRYFHLTIRFGVYSRTNEKSPKAKVIELIKTITNENPLSGHPELVENTIAFWLKILHLNTSGVTTVLIFDQFEELFSYPEDQITELKKDLHELIYLKTSSHFRENIFHLAEEDPDIFSEDQLNMLSSAVNVRMLFAIRSDHLSMLNHLTDYLPNLQRTFYELKPLEPKEARNAIVNPATIEGDFPCQKFKFTEEAVEKIISALSDNGKQPIETFQLQIVCQHSEGIILKHQTKTTILPDDLGDIKDIHQSFYNTLITELPTECEEEKARLRVLLEEQFIYEPEQRRLQVFKGIILKKISEQTLSALEKTHLIRSEPYQDSFTYELSHDTLVEPILKSYRIRKEAEDRIESEKRRKEEMTIIRLKARRQRRTIIIITSAACISTGLAIFGGIMWRKAEEEKSKALRISQNLRSEQQNSRKLAFEKYLNIGNSLMDDANYDQAIQNYRIAKEFTDDTTALVELINDCLEKSKLEKDFNSLMTSGILFQNEENYVEALRMFNAAKRLNFDNKSVLLKLTELNSKIDIAVRDSKQKATVFIDAGGFEDAYLILVKAQKMKPDDPEITQLLLRCKHKK